MKQKIFIIFTIFFLTGCNKNILKCEKIEKNPGYVYKETYELIYNDNGEEIKNINIDIDASFNEMYNEDEIDEQFETVSNYCASFEYADKNMIRCTSNRDGNNLNVQIFINATEIDSETFEKIMYVSKEEIFKKSETKKRLENVGYSCAL